MGVAPGALIDDSGDQIALADLLEPIQDAVKRCSFSLTEQWLCP